MSYVAPFGALGLSPGIIMPAAWKKLMTMPANVTNSQLQWFSTFAVPTHLNCRLMNISDSGLAYLKQFPLLYLDVSYCTNITDTGFLHLP